MPLVVKIQQNKSKAAASEVISTLHNAKQEVAKELEANLKQLKSVLEDTQRIAKEMESVLQEAKNEPSDQQRAQGNSEQSGSQQDNKKSATATKGNGKQGNGKQGQSEQGQDTQQTGKQQDKGSSADSGRDKSNREIQVKVVSDRTYVAARPKAWVPPPYRTSPGSKGDPGVWVPPTEEEENYF